MSSPMALNKSNEPGRERIPLYRHAEILAAYGLALTMARMKPIRIRGVLRLVSSGSRCPASLAEATEVYNEVYRALPRARGAFGCLAFSLTCAFMLRSRGVWPTWCAGVRTQPPFAAHAWIEADSRVVGETIESSALATLIRVGHPSRTLP